MDTCNPLQNHVIDFATPEDVPGILKLIRDLAVYERAESEVIVNEPVLLEHGFGTQKMFETLVVRLSNGELAGMALFYPKFSTWKGPCLYLEDFIVRQEYRHRGIGEKLFRKVVEYARKQNMYAIHWQVLHWNEPAIRFYQKQGCLLDNEWLNGKYILV